MLAKIDYYFYMKHNIYANKDGKQLVIKSDCLYLNEDTTEYKNKCSHLVANRMQQYENKERTTFILVWKHKDKIIGNGKTYLVVSINKF